MISFVEFSQENKGFLFPLPLRHFVSASLPVLSSVTHDAVMICWFLPLGCHLSEGWKPLWFSIPSGNTYRYVRKLFVEWVNEKQPRKCNELGWKWKGRGYDRRENMKQMTKVKWLLRLVLVVQKLWWKEPIFKGIPLCSVHYKAKQTTYG